MSGRDLIVEEAAAAAVPAAGVVIGELIAVKDAGSVPLVLYSGQHGTAGVAARSIIDLHAAHIGAKVVLMFESGDIDKPIVMGLLRTGDGWPAPELAGRVEADVDGERLVVSAREQLVLRCGKASVTLTKAGKVLIQGTYLLSCSSGVNRIKGASVQVN